MSAKYLLMPCSGRTRLNIPRGHVYEVVDVTQGNRKKEGYIRVEDAPAVYGEGNFSISKSDALCPLCNADIGERFRMKVIEPDKMFYRPPKSHLE